MAKLTESDLRQHTGSLDRYRHFPAWVIFTPGIMQVIEDGRAGWIVDLIASYMPPIIKEQYGEELKWMSFWRFKFENGGCVATCDDGNGNVKITQKIEYSDWTAHSDIEELLLYAQYDGERVCIMVPSEY